ncbi:LLM class flavin-dependent oxidoreductase [Kineococcus aurantiacus]|uniref:Alkanesulfonate monooxygenase SsuD/methylene tetrahydromethanopterin reductase-like flavin-dependent oxidoreductase (Luciferase family) n=1 Tax=Kineococcus aurantiacus TaxID=37633 RepID=A0A7Y9J101_9ACTN|nr:alkanesulfonate monooxygenase SsuD/methylene tetrahydromethanopterin reductase-like flavin-dependent oxidoreductase (luciferase family) [Kineococcus aurantiacus]
MTGSARWRWGAVTTFPRWAADGDAAVELLRRLGRAGAGLVLVDPAGEGPQLEGSALAAFASAVPAAPAVLAGTRSAEVPPYLLARELVTLDHLTHGRSGWWCTDTAADPGRVDEHLDVVARLCASWEPGAVVRDRVSGAYADHRKVHPVDHAGTHYRVRGPLNTVPPRRQPVVVLDGAAPEVVDVAARRADVLVLATGDDGVHAARDRHADAVARLRAGLVAAGRAVTACTVLVRVPAGTRPADLLAAVRDRGADGFLLDLPLVTGPALDRALADVTAGLVPDLVRAGVLGPARNPGTTTLREHLEMD